MRMIDADALIADIKECIEVKDSNFEWEQVEGLEVALSCVDDAPTIEPEPHWIKCSERLPLAECGESDKVLATCGHHNDTSVRWIRELYFNGGNWCYPTGEPYALKVYAWMPLPEPFREVE